MSENKTYQLILLENESIISTFWGIILTNKRLIWSGEKSYQAKTDAGSPQSFNFKKMVNILLGNVDNADLGTMTITSGKNVGFLAGGIILLFIGVIAIVASSVSYSSTKEAGTIIGAVLLIIGVILLIAYSLSGSTSTSNTIEIKINSFNAQIAVSEYRYLKTKEEQDAYLQITLSEGQKFINEIIKAREALSSGR